MFSLRLKVELHGVSRSVEWGGEKMIDRLKYIPCSEYLELNLMGIQATSSYQWYSTASSRVHDLTHSFEQRVSRSMTERAGRGARKHELSLRGQATQS